jgi:hypothetical protein
MKFLTEAVRKSYKIIDVERRTRTWELRESCLQVENAKVMQMKLLEGVLGSTKNSYK